MLNYAGMDYYMTAVAITGRTADHFMRYFYSSHQSTSVSWPLQGERCSFPVQMWAYHLKAFKHDLWQVFAYDVAAKLLAAVLAEGLIILSQRYSSVKPSMRRLPQMKLAVIPVRGSSPLTWIFIEQIF